MSDSWSAIPETVRTTFARLIHQRDAAQPDYRCPQCGQPIDWQLAWPHPMAKTVDHTIERQDGGPLLDLANARSMHKICNESKGSRRWHQRRGQRADHPAPLHIDPHTL